MTALRVLALTVALLGTVSSGEVAWGCPRGYAACGGACCPR